MRDIDVVGIASHNTMKVQNLYIKAQNIIFDMRNYSYINPYTNEPDDDEYLYMIQHAELWMSETSFYVIMLKNRAERLDWVNVIFKYATEQEIERLKSDNLS